MRKRLTVTAKHWDKAIEEAVPLWNKRDQVIDTGYTSRCVISQCLIDNGYDVAGCCPSIARTNNGNEINLFDVHEVMASFDNFVKQGIAPREFLLPCTIEIEDYVKKS